MAAIRMYVQKGCPHCESAKQFFDEQKITVETVEIGFDPIIQAGIRTPTGPLPVPIIISFPTQEAMTGNDPAQLQSLVDRIRSTIASNPTS